MTTAVDTLISELQSYRTSERAQPIIAVVNDMIAALQELKSGGGADPFSVISLLINGNTYLKSLANGKLELLNNTQNGFSSLIFGADGTLNPQITSDGTFFQFVNGVGQFVTIRASKLNLSGLINFNANTSNLLMTDQTAVDFGRLQLGGTTSSYPAIKRNSAALAARLADDSADANLSAAAGTFSGQLVGKGTSTNDNAAAGYIGEYITSSLPLGSAIPLATNVTSDIASISLTAGDWEIRGNVFFTPNVAATPTEFDAGINNVAATLPVVGSTNRTISKWNTGKDYLYFSQHVGPTRYSLSATTTLYLPCQATFAAGTVSAFGTISARRIR